MNRIDIYEFTDLTLFLRTVFDHFRVENPNFTVRQWAVRMGLSSPKPLVGILQETREPKFKDLDFLLKGLDLSTLETRFFEMLLILKKTKDSAEKSTLRFVLELAKKDLALTDPPTNVTLHTVFESLDDDLFSHWTDAAVLSAMELKSARADFQLLRENLLWEKDEKQIDRSLEKIRKLKLLDSDRENSPKYEIITTKSDTLHRGARAYFKQVNAIATEAIELPMKQREFQCFSIPARFSETPRFKQMIRNFREDIQKLSTDDGDMIYQFNLEMFPLTKPMIAGRFHLS
jgi:uncharacterized protein (TIGR02147 family)